ncbi:MAG: anaerobic ribonucleoside-triphosphate reductase activating protein, partial [Bacteroidetes bacterium]|nr:anaerobic ribonucleoside-triphosphate reductase activating protein [Bacteroidota bacterium]
NGCNFRCGYCYNSDLVLNYNNLVTIPEKDFFNFLESRRDYLQGVCITGGEPTLYRSLPKFCEKIKSLGYLVKLDTNGTNPDLLKILINNKLIDYIAMDIKASLKNYEKIIGVKVDKEKIKRSIAIIKESKIDYEFRTTIVPDVIDEKEIIEIGKMLNGCKRYFIQQFKADKKSIDKKYNDMESLSNKKLHSFKEVLNKNIKDVKIRNIF